MNGPEDEEVERDDEDYGYCNACGEETRQNDECCEDGEWIPA